MNSCLYEGQVFHHRLVPAEHRFSYRMMMICLDTSELDSVFQGRWLWSTSRPAWVRFRRSDYIGPPETSLDTAVRDIAETRTGTRPTGRICVVTNPRFAGFLMNPVSFYFCFGDDGARWETLIAEVTNTPWRERHTYVLTRDELDQPKAKQFHVSPFLPMNLTYTWQASEVAEQLDLAITCHEETRRVFTAGFRFRRRELTGRNMALALLRYPFMSWRVAAGIYWQALRLKLKGVPFIPHPKHSQLPLHS